MGGIVDRFNGSNLSLTGGSFMNHPFFALVDVEGAEVKTVEVVANPYYGAHQPGPTLGYGMSVFKPKVEHVADKMEFSGSLALGKAFPTGRVSHPCHKRPFPVFAIDALGRAKMQVRRQMHARRTHFSNALAKAFSNARPLKWVAKTWPSRSINIVWGMLLIP